MFSAPSQPVPGLPPLDGGYPCDGEDDLSVRLPLSLGRVRHHSRRNASGGPVSIFARQSRHGEEGFGLRCRMRFAHWRVALRNHLASLMLVFELVSRTPTLPPTALQVKMRKRQLEAFSQTDCVAMCTVAGMLEAHGMGSHGEITPIHMCDLLQQVRTRRLNLQHYHTTCVCGSKMILRTHGCTWYFLVVLHASLMC